MANQTFDGSLGLLQETLLVFVLTASTVVHASDNALDAIPIAALMCCKVSVRRLSSFGFHGWATNGLLSGS
jgi:hypothetical protein